MYLVLVKVTYFLSLIMIFRHKLANCVESRVLIPAISECYLKMLKHSDFNSIAHLMNLLSESFASNVRCTPELSTLFLRALAFRSEYSSDSVSVDQVEPHVLSTLTNLVLKLSESAFRPLYHKIYDWAIRTSDDPQRAITFYR